MLEILFMKQVDIYIAIATSIFGAVLGFVLSYFFAPTAVNEGNTTNVIQAVTINNIKNNASDISRSPQADDQTAMLFGALFLFIGLTIYLFFRTAILYVLLYSEVLLLSVWLGAVLRAYLFGGFKGFSWVVYLFYVAVFLVAYFVAIQLAISPIHAPDNFSLAEEIINRSGWFGIRRYFSIEDLPWGAAH
jgi:NADH:ubiquinone oxidoreductase subunit K